ncbi:MAG: hypothetical protein DRG24_04065 [Epsilonproteobacteria bacterium]|nr:MAG: hypothetical protein DRG24_04065 [Campylobacterota bacterium]
MKNVLLLLMTVIISLSASSVNDKIDYLANVKELVVLTQKMRGNTNVYLKGGYITLSTISEDRDEVAASLRSLHHNFKIVGFKVDDEFATLNLYMQSLNDVAADLNTMTTFQAYSLLIKEMISIGEKVQVDFFMDELELDQRVSSIMMKNILPLTEQLGKLRGFGAGAAVCRECAEDERYYLQEYIDTALEDLRTFVLEMKSLAGDFPELYSDDIDAHLNLYQSRVRDYLQLVELKLMDGNDRKIDTYDFFSQGTSLIDQTLKYYDMNEIILRD